MQEFPDRSSDDPEQAVDWREVEQEAAAPAVPAGEGAASHVPVTEVRVADVAPEEWDRMVLGFDDVLQEQVQSFNEVRRAPDKLRRLAVYADGELTGAALVRLVKVPMLGCTISSLRWGPLWRRTGRPATPATMDLVLRALTDQLCRREKGFLMIMPRPDPDMEAVPGAVLQRLGFQSMPPLSNPLRYFARVDHGPEALRANFSQKWRYNLKKAEAAGLETELVEGEAGMNEILGLYHEMLARKKFVDYSPIDTLAHRLANPLEILRPRMFVTRKDGVPVAMAVVDCCGDTASFLYGATADEALPLRAGYALQWAVLCHLSRQPAIRWYALGGGGSATCPLHQFKRGLVGKVGVILHELPPHFLAEGSCAKIVGRLAMSGRALRDRVREPLSQMIPVRLGR
ncbi:lipid II:glycine glycyltransferase FemX [Stappia indica]|uniref:lipid II:glycine glycyltransferase FemX n=1 Tax=Stappia indica TaxID=538381 RepID=UPI001CD40BCE|nr:GNAT family N-acetyltransferase [Stappia indica]MCA1299339.1 GNAT family N-acetyltransferase [Stappia indica]